MNNWAVSGDKNINETVMLMNNKTIHSEMIKIDTPGFDDESNKKNSIYLDVIQVTALLEYCICSKYSNLEQIIHAELASLQEEKRIARKNN